MSHRDYNVLLKFPTYFTSERLTYDGTIDQSDQAIRDCISTYEQYDPECVPQVLGVQSIPDDEWNIDWQVLKDMKTIRSTCDLGKKLRATSNINLRQPLQSVYIYVSDYVTRFNILGKPEEYSQIIEEELNVHEVIFINDVSDNTLFDISMKPNFRALGPKGYGKLAQVLKKTLEKLSVDQSNAIYHRLVLGTINDFGFPLSLEDVEVVLKPKDGLKSFTNDAGAVILDTRITPFLKKKGLIYELKSCIQKMRRDKNLLLQDKVVVNIYTASQELADGIALFNSFLMHECIIEFLTVRSCNDLCELTSDSCVAIYDGFAIDLKRI